MKTNQTMERPMGEFLVYQRTKDKMFNATSLLKQFNGRKRGREVSEYLSNKNTKEYIQAIEDEEGIVTGKVVSVKRGGNTATQGTWMHPLLFLDFAMWINPRFKVKVVKFVYDELIKYRHEAGDKYIALASAGSTLKGYNYPQVAKAIQWIVFNTTGKNLRQKATQDQLKEISDIEKNLAFSIDMGYIKSFESLMIQLRKMYNKKY